MQNVALALTKIARTRAAHARAIENKEHAFKKEHTQLFNELEKYSGNRNTEETRQIGLEAPIDKHLIDD